MWQPVLRGTKIILFLLGIAVVSFTLIAMISRPTKAENFILNASCFLGIAGDQDCDPPSRPVLVAPGDYVPSNSFVFSWEPVSDQSAVTYEICVSGSSSSCVETGDATSVDATSLIANEAGTWQWRVRATDSHGFIGSWSETKSVILDDVNPYVTFSASPLLIGGNTATTTLTGQVSDAHLLSYELKVTNPSSESTVLETQTVDASSADVSFVFNALSPTKLASGIYIFTLQAADKSGRVIQLTTPVEVDNDGPELTVTGGDTIVKSGSISPNVSASDPHGDPTYNWVADADNADAISYDASAKEPSFTPTTEGSYTFTLNASDSLGNVSSESFHFDYWRDLPVLPLPTDPTAAGAAPEVVDANLPSVVSPSSNATNRATSEETSSAGDTPADVLGAVVSGGGDPIESAQLAALTPTQNGWSILGVLWYWWLIVIAGVFTAALILRRRFGARVEGGQ